MPCWAKSQLGMEIARRRGCRRRPKAPNQLGLYDMCGNVWEWWPDTYVANIDAVPRDGTPYLVPSTDRRRLRGGCHHNWDIHCTVWWRYEKEADTHDECIGFRLVLAPA